MPRPTARHGTLSATIAFAFVAGNAAWAGPADVVRASATCTQATCSFVVMVRHDDEGWSHYANAWEVLAPDGTLLARRVLRHPHVEEQPFQRGLRGVSVPPELRSVRIRARDSVHGLGGKELTIPLAGREARPPRETPEARRSAAPRAAPSSVRSRSE